MTTFDMVREFHRTFSHPIKTKTLDDRDFVELRLRLILEEVQELFEACGYYVIENDKAKLEIVRDEAVDIPDLIECADALGDIDYVVCGMAVGLGLPHDKIVREIHSSNMSKLGIDGKPIYRPDGKVLKGPKYFQPRIKEILDDER